MAKFKVYLTGMAVVSQSQVIEADNAEEARTKAVQPDKYNNSTWEYMGVESETVDCFSVEEWN